ncbi:egf-like repeat and discoidin i-like domain-containing protein 3 [Limosa lapponica baueri]|uniref:Egf-like repeat and discoidin i-like domain-containing protein 3 n=1 Tax=Limosa lapponica baueri TaxID=1758121 RepID=A0A2I0U767_LIMLA|nr:egf-like repeat and discoidin i-like domain-containing protein 3 [Limosa lapponica baueri]
MMKRLVYISLEVEIVFLRHVVPLCDNNGVSIALVVFVRGGIAVQKAQARKEEWRCCPLHQETDHEELSPKNSHKQVGSLWVRRRDRGNKENLLVGVYYRLHNQGEPIDETSLLQLQEALRSKALVLLGDFNHPDSYWKSSTVSSRQSGGLLECIEDNFLSQVIDSPTRGDAILDLRVTSARELIGDMKIGGSLGCSDHAVMQFTVLRDIGQGKSKALNFRKANYGSSRS